MCRASAKPQSRSYPARRWQRYAGVTFRKGNRAATKTGPTRRRNPSGRRRGVWELGRLCLPHAAHSSARRRNFDLAEVSFLRVDQAGCAECWRTPILFWCRSVRELGWQDESAQQTNAILITNGWKASCSKLEGEQGAAPSCYDGAGERPVALGNDSNDSLLRWPKRVIGISMR
jgi:hypothetical protein